MSEKSGKSQGILNLSIKWQPCITGPIVRRINSLTSLLRDQLIKCFMTLQPNTLILLVEKMKKAFAVQKLLFFFFLQKILAYFRY